VTRNAVIDELEKEGYINKAKRSKKRGASQSYGPLYLITDDILQQKKLQTGYLDPYFKIAHHVSTEHSNPC
jgi:hypothetical protein